MISVWVELIQVFCPALLDIIDKQSTVGGLLITSQFPTEKWHSFLKMRQLRMRF